MSMKHYTLYSSNDTHFNSCLPKCILKVVFYKGVPTHIICILEHNSSLLQLGSGLHGKELVSPLG